MTAVSLAPPTAPTIGLLGTFEIADLPTASKERQTLALLAVHAGKTVSSELLIEELWSGEKTIGFPRQSMQTYVYHIRNRGIHLIDHHRQHGYRLCADPFEVDATRFTSFVDRARHAFAEGRDREATDVLLAALSLWRGPILANVTHGPVLTRWIQGMEDRYRTARLLRFDIALKLGHHRDILDDLRGELRADRSREDIAETLMVALYRSQRRAEALNIYRTVREALAEEHGLDPCPRLQRLQQQILSGDPGLELNGETR